MLLNGWERNKEEVCFPLRREGAKKNFKKTNKIPQRRRGAKEKLQRHTKLFGMSYFFGIFIDYF